MSNIFAEYAAKYAERGYHVFPCVHRGKTPLTKNGKDDASTDLNKIAEWAEQYPNANIGLATGPSDLVVLDVDVGEGKQGKESLRELYKDPALKEALNKTKRVRTGTGGYHFYFKPRSGVEIRNSAGKLGPGLDIRGDGGYVIAPPSVNSEGNEYKTEHAAPPVELPLELVAKLEVKRWIPTTVGKTPVMEGGRNDFLMRQGSSMRARGLEQDEIYAAISAINGNRCNPPLEDDEVRQIAGSVARYEPGEALERDRVRYAEKQSERGRDTKKGKKKLELKSYKDIVKERLEWLWYGRIARGKFGLLVGLPGKTKSYLTCYVIAKVTNGEPLPDDFVNLNPEPKSVLLITYEDGQGDTIKPRLEKCGANMDRVYTIPTESESFTKDDWDALELALQEHPDIKLVVIDPIQAIMAGENDNSETVVRAALNPALQIGHKYGVAFLGVKHLNKDESKSIDNRVGGSVAYTGLARTIMFAGHDCEKELEKGVTYAAVMVTKGNIAGRVSPISYEVNDRGLFILGPDDSITPERLLPRAPDRKKKDR